MTQIDPTNNVEWKEFKLEDIFNIESGKRLTKSDMKSGDLPFIGATDSNNGITNFVSNTNTSLDSNVLGVNYNGSVVENFYHPYECIFSDDVKRLSFKDREGNKYLYLFFKTIILQQKEKYRYGYKFNEDRMKRQSILVPVNKSGEPDWHYMQEFMMQIEREIKPNLKFIPHIVTDRRELSDVNLGEFKVGDLFDIFTGSDLILSRTKEGDIPVVTHQEGNNGIRMFAEKDIKRPLFNHKDTISLADRGTFKAYTQPADFYIGTRVKALKLKHKPVTKYTLLYLTTAINMQQKIFSYGYNATNNVGRIIILLPITSQGEPDWEFMEQYMKRKENQLMGMEKTYED